MRWLVGVLAIAACVPAPAPVGARYTGQGAPNAGGAQPALQPPWTGPRFVGTYRLGDDLLELYQKPDGRIVGAIVGETIRLDFEGTVQGDQLVGTIAMGSQRAPFTATLHEPYLDVMTNNGKVMRLSRAEDPSRAPNPGPPAAPPTTTATAPGGPLPPPLAAATNARGDVYTDKIDGWLGTAPAGWTFTSPRIIQDPKKQSKIVVTFYRGLNLQSAYDKFHADVPKAEQFGALREGETVGAGPVLTVEYDQREGDLRWRAHWIQGREGVLEVMLITTNAELDRMRAVVDNVARSLSYVAPVRGKTELAGRCYRFAKSSFGTFVERTLGLDPKTGNAHWGGFVNANVTYETYGGKYLGETNDLIHADGENGVFAIQGDKLIVHWNDGRISTWFIRWDQGRVRMLVQDGDPYVSCS